MLLGFSVSCSNLLVILKFVQDPSLCLTDCAVMVVFDDLSHCSIFCFGVCKFQHLRLPQGRMMDPDLHQGDTGGELMVELNC
ncbi:MAG: hypothetical protein COB90_10360 [Hyphomicrobiales bacterium]|nr:MAG: hypothetical protein COB90_10360 [Hyphomicrobiales bacterium]